MPLFWFVDGYCLGVHCLAPNSSIEALNHSLPAPIFQNVTIIGDKGFQRGDSVKVSPLGEP